MSSPWHFGNTTVRNPMRIRDGLIVLRDQALSGNLIGTHQEILFTRELVKAGVINHKDTDPDFFGRKWRSCFTKLGFITHKFKKKVNSGEADPIIAEVIKEHPELGLTGVPYQLTPSGLRMIEAQTAQEQQECMLRALLAIELPSPIEKRVLHEPFKPFVFILQVLKRLEALEYPLGLTKAEMGIVQSYRDHSKVEDVIGEILKHREKRDKESGRAKKRAVDNELIKQLALKGGVKVTTINDYADVNFRYPRLTGLVSYKGKRLVISEIMAPVIDEILVQEPKLIGALGNSKEYLLRFWKGSELPTDNEETATQEIKRFRRLLIDSGVDETFLPEVSDTEDIAQLNQIRIRLEELYKRVLEKNYASEQKDEEQVKEIIAYLKKIDKQPVGEEYDIDIEDPPSYLEWAVWRAFLAINQLVNEPHEARRFKVDQDFFPMGCAPGGGPDLIFEFEDYVLVVEVTLTTSSRQEAAEGEPVRRHVAREKAKVAEETGKPVYGLFLARTIDNNTAETFRIGVWYNGDEADFINIVPITLKQFILMMEKYVSNRFDNKAFRRVLDTCLIPRNAHAPAWKREIEKVVNGFLN